MITSRVRILGGQAPALLSRSPAEGETRRQGERQKFSNQHGATRNAYPQRSRNVLSRPQKAALCIKARQAFERAHSRPPANALELKNYRHEQVKLACGKPGLTAATQDDYKLIEAWFHHLMGEEGAARAADERYATEPARVAMVKLQEALAAKGLHPGYAAAICRAQNKCELAEASAPQLWRLVFTIKNRKPAKPAAQTAKKPATPAAAAKLPTVTYHKVPKPAAPVSSPSARREDNEPF